MPLTQMLLACFGIAGFINPGFWLLGLAAFVAFVGGRSASERFQKLVEGERLLARSGDAEDKMKAAYDRSGRLCRSSSIPFKSSAIQR